MIQRLKTILLFRDCLIFSFLCSHKPRSLALSGNPTIFIFNDYLSSSAKNCSHFEFEPCETNIQPLRSMKAGKDRFQPCFCVCRRFSRALMLHIHISASRARSALIWISNISVCFTVTWGASVCGCVLGKTSKDETRQIIFYWFYHKTQRVTQLPKSRNKHSSLDGDIITSCMRLYRPQANRIYRFSCTWRHCVLFKMLSECFRNKLNRAPRIAFVVVKFLFDSNLVFRAQWSEHCVNVANKL